MGQYILFILTIYSLCFAAQNSPAITQKLIASSFNKTDKEHLIKRKLVIFNTSNARLNPLNYLCASILFVYQNVFSEQIQADCTFEISCSEYTKLSIQKNGLFIGTLKGFNQLSECSPSAIYEHPPVYLNQNQKIINHLEKEGK